jgi:hypothetical protein
MGPLHLGKTPIVTACVRQADHVTPAVMFSNRELPYKISKAAECIG